MSLGRGRIRSPFHRFGVRLNMTAQEL